MRSTMLVIKSNLPQKGPGKCIQYKTRSIFREYCLIKSYMTLQLTPSETIELTKFLNAKIVHRTLSYSDFKWHSSTNRMIIYCDWTIKKVPLMDHCWLGVISKWKSTNSIFNPWHDARISQSHKIPDSHLSELSSDRSFFFLSKEINQKKNTILKLINYSIYKLVGQQEWFPVKY